VLETYVREAISRTGIKPSRERGQHFLIDDAVLAAVVSAARLRGDEWVVEIGPGLGTLTQSLASRCARLHAYELDDRLSGYLVRWVLPDTRNVVLHDQAFNRYVFEPVVQEAEAGGHPLKIVTNLPYQISSQFLQTVAEYSERLEQVVVMLQREVANRVLARPGEPNFGSFSLYMQTFVAVRRVIEVPPDSFYPPPRVNSSVISMTPLPAEDRPLPVNRTRYFKLVRGVFKHRRKQLLNALQLTFSHLTPAQAAAVLNEAGIDHTLRPQNLGIPEYVRLADMLEANLPAGPRTPKDDEDEGTGD
jgi:16S rRNA (adenine1518-N6/adenine1519-N6)-dimethyltransferase